MLFCGIDGGGTHTRCALIDGLGRLVGEGFGGPSNVSDIGVDGAVAAICEAVAAAMENAGTEEAPRAVFAGIAGALAARESIREELQELMPDAIIGAGSDADNVIYAGLDGRDGTALICGTGCSVLSVKDGQLKQTGGWGYLIGDGGGFDIGRAALSRILSAYDGRQEPCPILTDKVNEILGGKVWESIAEIYSGGKPLIAAIVPAVFGAIDAGSVAARQIVDEDIDYVAQCVKVGAEYAGTPKVAYTGGVLENQYAIGRLRELLPDLDIQPLPMTPQMGAARRAVAMYVYSQVPSDAVPAEDE